MLQFSTEWCPCQMRTGCREARAQSVGSQQPPSFISSHTALMRWDSVVQVELCARATCRWTYIFSVGKSAHCPQFVQDRVCKAGWRQKGAKAMPRPPEGSLLTHSSHPSSQWTCHLRSFLQVLNQGFWVGQSICTHSKLHSDSQYRKPPQIYSLRRQKPNL